MAFLLEAVASTRLVDPPGTIRLPEFKTATPIQFGRVPLGSVPDRLGFKMPPLALNSADRFCCIFGPADQASSSRFATLRGAQHLPHFHMA